jgi:hypothetical protein
MCVGGSSPYVCRWEQSLCVVGMGQSLIASPGAIPFSSEQERKRWLICFACDIYTR